MKQFLVLLLAVVGIGLGSCTNSKVPMFIGLTSGGDSTGIYSCLFDTITGSISDLRRERDYWGPSFITLSPNQRFLYSFGMVDGHYQALYTCRISEDGRTLQPVDSVLCPVREFCHISTTTDGNYLLTVSYAEGKTFSYPTDSTGRVFNNPSLINHLNPFATPASPKKSHAHTIRQDPNSENIYVTDLGLDSIFIFRMGSNGLLKQVSGVSTAPGAGPRHLDFHPSGTHMSVINELNNTIDVYAKDSLGFFSQCLQNISTVPAGFDGERAAADIHYSADGRFLYASDRGTQSIIWYGVSPEKGTLTLLGSISEKVNWPRNFTLDPSGKWLLVANERGGNITVYAINPQDGSLTLTPKTINVPTPSCLLFPKP